MSAGLALLFTLRHLFHEVFFQIQWFRPSSGTSPFNFYATNESLFRSPTLTGAVSGLPQQH